MVKWIGRLLCSTLVLSMASTANTPLIYGEGANVTSSSATPQSKLEQAITSVKVADGKGKWSKGSYQVQLVKNSEEFPYIESIFPDRSGEHMIITYLTDITSFEDGVPLDGMLKMASIQIKDGKKVWDAVIDDKPLWNPISQVEANGEILLSTRDDKGIYLHAIDEKTGHITRVITQATALKDSAMRWKYWLVGNNQLLVSYATNNQSTLRYFDANGVLIKTRIIRGIARDANQNRIVVTDGSSDHYTLRVQDHQGHDVFKHFIQSIGYFSHVYLLPDSSVVLESQGTKNGRNLYHLTQYNAKGIQQWDDKILDESFSSFVSGNQLVGIFEYQKKIVLLNNKGKVIKQLINQNDANTWMVTSNKQVQFIGEDHHIRIADLKNLNWLAEITYSNDESAIDWLDRQPVTWLSKQQLAIYDSQNKIISVIRITSK